MGECLLIRKGDPIIPKYDANHICVLKLDETSGSTAVDTMGNFDGTVTGATIVDGYKGKARAFAGGLDRIDFSNQVIPLGAKTIRFKIKTSQSTDVYIFENNRDTTVAYGTSISLTSKKIKFFSSRNVSASPRFSVTTATEIADDKWYDVMFTWDGSTTANMVKIYIKALEGDNKGKFANSLGVWVDDFVPNATGTAVATETTNASYNLMIGKYRSDTSHSFVGLLDEIEISDIARTDMKDYR